MNLELFLLSCILSRKQVNQVMFGRSLNFIVFQTMEHKRQRKIKFSKGAIPHENQIFASKSVIDMRFEPGAQHIIPKFFLVHFECLVFFMNVAFSPPVKLLLNRLNFFVIEQPD